MSLPRLLLGTFLPSTALYTASTGRERPWGDGYWQSRMPQHLSVGRPDMNDPAEGNRFLVQGVDGRWYVAFSLGASLSHSLGAGLTKLLVLPEHRELGWALCHRASSSVWGAATAALFVLFLLQLGVGAAPAFLAAMAVGFGTPLWGYARSDFLESFQAFCLLFGVWALWRTAERPSAGRALVMGLAAGVLVVAKLTYLPILAFGGLWSAWQLRDRPAALGKACGWALLLFVPLAGAELAWSFVRSGSRIETARRFDHSDVTFYSVPRPAPASRSRASPRHIAAASSPGGSGCASWRRTASRLTPSARARVAALVQPWRRAK